MSREDARTKFVDAYLDEMTGILMRPFHSLPERTSLGDSVDASHGREMIKQMRKCRELLGRIFDQHVQRTETKEQPKGK